MGSRSTPSTLLIRPSLCAVLPLLTFVLVLLGSTARAAPQPEPIPVPAPGLGLLEAVELLLLHDPNLGQVEARLTSSEGALLSARGGFDPVVRSSLTQAQAVSPTGETDREEERTLVNTVGVTKRFRSGLSIEPDLSLSRSEDTLAGGPGANVGTVGFTFRQPLLRGRGREAVAAGELSAERQLAASRIDVRQTVSERVLAVVFQYWNYKAAVLNLGILLETEARSRELMATTRRLIESDITPAAELVLLEANLAAQEVSRIAGERAVFAARQDLGREIGLDPRQIGGLPAPADDFPVVTPAEVPPAAETDRLIAGALARRDDLRAARERQESVVALLRAADNLMKPQLDLIVRPSYSGFVEGTGPGDFYSPLFRNVPGLSTSFGFSLSWPTFNGEARGLRLQREAALRESALIVEAFEKIIGADVPTALDAVARQAQRLQKAEEAVRLFERAVSNEEKKLRAGSSTLLDLINQQDRLTAARQSRVSAQLDLALALAELRFQTGTLLGPAPAVPAAATAAADPAGQAGTVDYRRLTTLPTPEETAPR
ncbi:MAG TPA: TolC family protein [Thermoanaerobaculia bacterium]|nr:TolC family protein [Thermoanaerobaculia bacterium]